MNIEKGYKDENLYYYGYRFAVLVDRSQTKKETLLIDGKEVVKEKLQRIKKQQYYCSFRLLENALSFISKYFGNEYYDRFVNENLFKIVK